MTSPATMRFDALRRAPAPIRVARLLAALIVPVLLLTVLMTVLAGAQQAGASPAAPVAEWFRLGDEALADWSVERNPDRPDEVTLRPRRAPAGPLRRVLVVYPRPSDAYDVAMTTMLAVFSRKGQDLAVTAVNFGNDDARGRALLRHAADEGVSLILAMGSESTAWLWEHYRGGAIPVVTVCSKDPVLLGQAAGYDRGSGTNFAFTSLNVPIDVQMAYLKTLKPALTHIAVIEDPQNVSALETQVKPLLAYAQAHGLRVTTLSLRETDPAAELERRMRETVAAMARTDPPLAASVFWVTGSTSIFRQMPAINAHAGRVPVLSAVPDLVKAGEDSAALSIGIRFESNAHLAALYALDVLSGRVEVGRLAVGVISPPDIAVSFRRLRATGTALPLALFEAAGTLYDYENRAVRTNGVSVGRMTVAR
jgi:putative ABC transport system substrate-binding protein